MLDRFAAFTDPHLSIIVYNSFSSFIECYYVSRSYDVTTRGGRVPLNAMATAHIDFNLQNPKTANVLRPFPARLCFKTRSRHSRSRLEDLQSRDASAWRSLVRLSTWHFRALEPE